ncbi:MAG: T9SS type A sorting domain-containing protein [bacterium]|nr:T9SS type A sorting domain-containing protein [bacterium]
MRNISFLVFLVFFQLLKSQTYVLIPDFRFASYLRAFYVPAAMKGDSLDISHPLVTTGTKSIVVRNPVYSPAMDGGVKDINGIQYFKALTYLDCSLNQSLTALPVLPQQLTDLICKGTSIKTFPALPKTLINFDCSYARVRTLPALPASLLYLNCDFDSLKTLPVLPGTLRILYCRANLLNSLPARPASLRDIDFSYNFITTVPKMPDSLFVLDCSSNSVVALPSPLPSALKILRCDSNSISCLPLLPATLKALNCSWNPLTNLPTLPSALEELYCIEARINCFPEFPASILPAYSLPLETGPAYLRYSIRIEGNPAKCVPNHLPECMRPQELAMPLCTPDQCSEVEREGSCGVELALYPNPTHGTFTIQLDKPMSATAQVYDLNGNLILEQSGNKKLVINSGFIADGLYLVRISTEEGIFNKKVIIMK